MHALLHNAIRDALSLVKKSNVNEATAVIRAALLGNELDISKCNPGPSPKLLSFTDLQRNKPFEVAPELTSTPILRNCEFPRPAAEREKRINPEGNFSSRTYHHSERNLDYMLYVPSENGARPQALLLMLHGCTQNPTDFALGTQMNKLADEFNFIVAYPSQPKTANSMGCWNWFDARHQKHSSGEPAMLADLSEHLRQKFRVSKKRVFVAGLSAGGAMAEVLATIYPMQFAAAGVHSGLPYGAASSLSKAFEAMKGSGNVRPPMELHIATHCRRIVFHGTADATVHPSNGTRIVSDARIQANNLKEIKLTTRIDGRNIAVTILEDESRTPIVEHWVITGGRHAWSGGNELGSFTDPKGPDASREMVRFFLHTKSGG